MTYNFDPERWYENQRAILERKLERAEIDEQAHRVALDDLYARYERMLERLDNTYRIPGQPRRMR